jgi:hypothetical protein
MHKRSGNLSWDTIRLSTGIQMSESSYSSPRFFLLSAKDIFLRHILRRSHKPSSTSNSNVQREAPTATIFFNHLQQIDMSGDQEPAQGSFYAHPELTIEPNSVLDQASEQPAIKDCTFQAKSRRNSQVREGEMGYFTGYHLVLLR